MREAAASGSSNWPDRTDYRNTATPAAPNASVTGSNHNSAIMSDTPPLRMVRSRPSIPVDLKHSTPHVKDAPWMHHSERPGAAMQAPAPQAPFTEAEVAALVARFYDRARLDPTLAPVFAAVEDWDAHQARVRAFWSSVLLGTGAYKGDPFGAHLRHPIEPRHFDAWLRLWAETAREVVRPELAQAAIARAGRIAESLQTGLFFRPILAERARRGVSMEPGADHRVP